MQKNPNPQTPLYILQVAGLSRFLWQHHTSQISARHVESNVEPEGKC